MSHYIEGLAQAIARQRTAVWVATALSVLSLFALAKWPSMFLTIPIDGFVLVVLNVAIVHMLFALHSLAFWFAPSRASTDPRPRYRRLRRFAVVYPITSTILPAFVSLYCLWTLAS